MGLRFRKSADVELFKLKSNDLVSADGMMEYCRYFNTFNGASVIDSRRLFEHVEQYIAPDPQVTMAFMGTDNSGSLCACALANSKLIVANDHNVMTYPVMSIISVTADSDVLIVKHTGGDLRLTTGAQTAAGLAGGLESSVEECQQELESGTYTPGKGNKKTLKKWWPIASIVAAAAVIFVIFSFGDNQKEETDGALQIQEPSQNTGVSLNTGASQDTATIGEQNALSQANSYLSISHFSASGLIEQLEFEGYTTAEAEYAVANCGADWNEQALRTAQSYLDLSGFSYSGLHDQLTYEGFLPTEVQYAIDNCGADWNQEAAEAAASYMDITSFSREGLIDQLLFEGFTQDQAEYGAEQVGY